jgi:type I restriction-modification system DNA methylase subunit
VQQHILGRGYPQRNEKLCTIITQIAEGIADFSNDSDDLGDAYEYLIGQFAAGGGKKAGEEFRFISEKSPSNAVEKDLFSM